MTTLLKLNLGCGGDIRPGYINIDLYVTAPGITNLDCAQLPYAPASCSEIIAQDVLEHLSHRDCHRVLAHWVSLLAPGGTLTIRCPDLTKQCECLLTNYWSTDTFTYMMFGGQDAPGNYHKSGWTMQSLTGELHSLGCDVKAETRHEGLTPSIATSCNPNLLVVATKL